MSFGYFIVFKMNKFFLLIASLFGSLFKYLTKWTDILQTVHLYLQWELSIADSSNKLLEPFRFKVDYVNLMQRDLLLACTVTQQVCTCDKNQSRFCSLASIEEIYAFIVNLLNT